jgi:hypothetical protein
MPPSLQEQTLPSHPSELDPPQPMGKAAEIDIAIRINLRTQSIGNLLIVQAK